MKNCCNKLIFTNNTPTTFNISVTTEVYWKKTCKFLILLLAKLSMREINNILLGFLVACLQKRTLGVPKILNCFNRFSRCHWCHSCTWISPLIREVLASFPVTLWYCEKFRRVLKTPEYLSDTMDGTNAGALAFYASTRRVIVVRAIAIFVYKNGC